MDEFLRKIREASESPDFGARNTQADIWYNEDGDCVQFKTMDVATIRRRIDGYLTIYYSAETRDLPIGFQLKDIKALINKYSARGVVVKTEVDNKKLISITALLVNVLTDLDPSIIRREGYTTALQSFPRERDDLLVPA